VTRKKAENKPDFTEHVKDLGRPVRIDSLVDSLFFNLFISHQASKRVVDKICSDNGISGPQYNVLRTLQTHGGKTTVKPLRDGMLHQASAVTRLIDKLIKAGCVKRQSGIKDRRIVYIKITEKGERLANILTEKIFSELGAAYSHMDNNEIEELIRLLVKSRQLMEQKPLK
jgi:MarR family transcriptional regulator, organic hydroperoxide resistance regulator